MKTQEVKVTITNNGELLLQSLGLSLNLPVITTDRLWSSLNLEIEVLVLR